MTEVTSVDVPTATLELSPESTSETVAHAVVLAIEGLISDAQFLALTGQPVSQIAALLTNSEMLYRVQELSLELQNRGTLARLEALRHVRAAVQITASILHNEDLHPGQRLAAAAELHRVAGTARPSVEGSEERHTIIINLGNDQPIVISNSAVGGSEL
jgi:hypothetical protein